MKWRKGVYVTDTAIDFSTISDTPLSIDECGAVIEAVLFAAGHEVSYDKLARVTGHPGYAVKNIIAAFAEKFNSENGGIQILMYENACQLCTREKYSPFIREALGIKRGGNLSQSSLETLAIIAYNEPSTRAFIDTVRGVDSSYAVSSLCDKGLIQTCGRLEVPGRPFLYKTTPDFLRCFGISSLAELPDVDLPHPGAQIPIKAGASVNAENTEAVNTDTTVGDIK